MLTKVKNLTYVIWKGIAGYGNSKCAILLASGKWDFGSDMECNHVVHKLCPICSIEGTPVFTLKGLDYTSWIDWNYYMHLGPTHEIEFYDGYKKTEIVLDDERWKVIPKNGNVSDHIDLTIKEEELFPVGRKKWNFHSSNRNSYQKLLSFSPCDYNEEFTCSSGHCIPQRSRCNHASECQDSSDEENCYLIDIPESNEVSKAPQIEKGSKKKISLVTKVEILSIDSIDTMKMVVGLTLKISVRWFDHRLVYRNLNSNGNETFIPENDAKKIWLPLDNVCFQNAVIGSLIDPINPQREIVIHSKSSSSHTRQINVTHRKVEEYMVYGSDGTEDSYEDLLHRGKDNELEMSQIFRLQFKCQFAHFTFPFDGKNCYFDINLKREEQLTIQFTKDKQQSVMYQGPTNVHQFKIGAMGSTASVSENKTTFTFHIPMNRNYMHHVISTFFPTLLLCFLSYSTLFIDLDRFAMRFQGSVIALLVYESLLNSITQSTPETAYFKMIDLWFIWHTVAMFTIILFHILIHKFSHPQEHNFLHFVIVPKIVADSGMPIKKRDIIVISCGRVQLNVLQLNYIMIFLFFLGGSIFYTVYFLIVFKDRNPSV